MFRKLPAAGLITQGFHAGHQAVDIDNVTGSPIVNEWWAGETYVRWNGVDDGDWNPETGRNGNWIMLDHYDADGRLACITQYMHLRDAPDPEDRSEPFGRPRSGRRIELGETFALMGNTGKVIPAPSRGDTERGSHLHWIVMAYGAWALANNLPRAVALDGRLLVAAPSKPTTPAVSRISAPFEIGDLQELWLEIASHPARQFTPAVATITREQMEGGWRVYTVRLTP